MVAMRITGRRLLAPEVVQSSAMDCGPATLKCLLEGHGIRASYGRLREACQTDVDGTSINTLEEVAQQLGLDAQQVMVPIDHLLIDEARALPAIVVVRLPSGANHFVVLWRTHGGARRGFVQLMDPATGRQWSVREQFLRDVYQHTHPVPAQAWRAWAATDEFLGPVRIRLKHVGCSRSMAQRMIDEALADDSWRGIGALDASLRMVDAMLHDEGIARGRQAVRVLQELLKNAHETDDEGRPMIPASFWSVRPAAEDEQVLAVRGAVLVRIRGRTKKPPQVMQPKVTPPEKVEPREAPKEKPPEKPLSRELEAALTEPPAQPIRDLFRMMRKDGLFAPIAIGAAMFLAALMIIIEALLFRGLLDAGRHLGLFEQRAAGIGLVLIFALGVLLLELPIVRGILRLGRLLELRLRIAFLRKLPRLSDRYVNSRLTSDMAERSHSVHALRNLPSLGMQLLRSSFALALTTAGIIWLDPGSAAIAISAAVLVVAVPLSLVPVLNERNMRVRTHAGAMSRFYLDALLGLVPIRMHGAERAVRREHEGLVAEWMRSSIALQRSVVSVEGVQMLIGFGLAAWLLMDHFGRMGESATVLLLIYWALSLPAYGQDIATQIRQYPNQRNVALRLMEPLGAPEREELSDDGDAGDDARRADERTARESRAASIEMRNVSVKAAGHEILNGVALNIEPGAHVAVVGPSGAGKSSLVGLLLGWHTPVDGEVMVDGDLLDGARLGVLRRATVWVDPSVQLWNRSLFENLTYGNDAEAARRIGWAISQTDLRRLLADLPQGLATPLGEGGALVSGGEGQRVRLARAMLRSRARLVILDEPFRGLDRAQRRTLLERARELWRDSTLLCITHDVEHTLAFDRVLVMEHGRPAEHGRPDELSEEKSSRYRWYLQAEREVRASMWEGVQWRRWRMVNGRLQEGDAERNAPEQRGRT